MGLIGRILGRAGVGAVGQAVTNVAEVFVPNATRAQEFEHLTTVAAFEQFGAEFVHGGQGVFDRFINGLNRLPRPFLALGTMGLFTFAMIDPVRFAERMEGLALVPDPLWWLLGAIVSFYFGARELHYRRRGMSSKPVKKTRVIDDDGASNNAALEAWRSERGG
ncbi:MAG: holin family protein [Litoreibacter sp.]